MITMDDCIVYTQSITSDDEIAGPYISPSGEYGCLGVQVLHYRYPERAVCFVVSHYEVDGEIYDIPEDINELCSIWYSQFCDMQEVHDSPYSKDRWLAFLSRHTEELGEACLAYLHACQE